MTTDRADALTLDQWHALSDAAQSDLLAERVMGWEPRYSIEHDWRDRWIALTPDGEYPETFARSQDDWHPTTSDADACAVLDRMEELGWNWTVSKDDAASGEVFAAFFRTELTAEEPPNAEAPTRPAAISLTAVRAVGAVQ